MSVQNSWGCFFSEHLVPGGSLLSYPRASRTDLALSDFVYPVTTILFCSMFESVSMQTMG